MTTVRAAAPVASAAALRSAMDALESAGVSYCVRGPTTDLVPEPGSDVDVLVSPSARRAAARPLGACGWRPFKAPGHWGHQFWLYLTDDAQWLKIDLVWRLRYGAETESTEGWLARRRLRGGTYIAAPEDDQRHRTHRSAGHRERPGIVERAARRVPPVPRRSGPVVAFIGPDGAGKGLVIDSLTARLPVAVTTGYLGVRAAGPSGRRQRSADAGTQPAAATEVTTISGGASKAPRVRAREIAFLSRKWLRTLPTFYRAYRSAWRGHVVLLDRHPLDTLAVRPRRSRWGGLWERMLAVHLTPRPDAVVVLDAPGTVLFARKGEHSPAVLEQWRRGYLSLRGADVHVVDATRPAEDVVRDVSRLVWRERARRRRWAPS